MKNLTGLRCVTNFFLNRNRVSCNLSTTSIRNTSGDKKEKLVILGTGWGSYRVLRDIKKNKSLLKRLSVVVISPRNHFLFTPLLASTTVGTLEFRSIIEPVRNTGFRDEHHFHLSHAVGLDMQNKIVHCRSALESGIQYDVTYDRLVIGVGATANDFGIPGVKEHVYFLRVGLCSTHFHGTKIISYIDMSRQNSLLTAIVIIPHFSLFFLFFFFFFFSFFF